MQGIHVLNKVAPRVASWLRGEGDITVNDLNTSPSSDIKYTVNLIIRGVIGDVIYVNVFKIDVIYIIFDFEDVIRYFCQNETLFLSKLDVNFVFLCETQRFCRTGQ